VRCGCGQDKVAVGELQELLQQLQTDVDNLNKASQRLSDELTAQRSDVKVVPLIFALKFTETAYDFCL